MGGTRDTSVAIRLRSLLLAGLVLLALVTAYLLGGRGESPARAAAPVAAPMAPGEKPRVVRMIGAGEAAAVPDQLVFTLSVSEKRADLDEALRASSATMKRVLGVIADRGVGRGNVQTTGLQMNPEYDYHSYGPPTLTGYRVTQRARVIVDELADGGRVISAAVGAGGNGVRATGIRLQVADPGAVLARARDQAVEEATAKAEQYAAATGQQLGEVLGIREVGSSARQRTTSVLTGSLDARAASLPVLPVRAGRDDLSVRIEVVWAFE